MKQITDATTVIAQLKSASVPRDARGVAYVLYAPGDSTLYRVSLITFWPAELESQLPAQTILTVSMNGDMIAIPKPNGQHPEWTPEQFSAKFNRYIGWWPAIRPLLATLRWTPESDRSTNFKVDDWLSISHLT